MLWHGFKWQARYGMGLASTILIGLGLNGGSQHAFFVKGHQLKKPRARGRLEAKRKATREGKREAEAATRDLKGGGN